MTEKSSKYQKNVPYLSARLCTVCRVTMTTLLTMRAMRNVSTIFPRNPPLCVSRMS